MKKIISILFVVLAAQVAWGQTATITLNSNNKLDVVVKSNKANGLSALVDTAMSQYNATNATSFTLKDIESLKLGGNITGLTVDLTKSTVQSVIDLFTGDNGDDASYVWTNMRATLKKLDLSSTTFYAHFSALSADSDTLVFDVPINVLPPKCFWRGIDVDTDLYPALSNYGNHGMSALEEVTLPTNLMGFSESTIKLLGTTISAYISDNAAAQAILNYITGSNARYFCGIGDYAFAFATSLKSITIPYNSLAPVKAIGNKAFYYNTALESLTFKKGSSLFTKATCGVNTIGTNAFAYTGLTSLALPQEVDSLAQGAFRNCTKLTSVTFEGTPTLQYIGKYAFLGDAFGEIAIPAKVTVIGDEVFRDCKQMAKVTILGTSDSLKLGEKLFYDTPMMSGGTLICNRTVVPVASAITKQTYFNAYNGTFAGLGSNKTANAMLHGSFITNAAMPVNETDTTLNITVPESVREAYLAADGWVDLLKAPAPQVLKGDVNSDGKVDTTDLSALMTIILNGGTVAENPAADVNGDGKIDTTDLSVLMQIILAA